MILDYAPVILSLVKQGVLVMIILNRIQTITVLSKWFIYAFLFVSLVVTMIACDSKEAANEDADVFKDSTGAVRQKDASRSSTRTTIVEGKPARLMSGDTALKEARTITEPFGSESVKIFATIRKNSFEKNINISNQWIKDQISFYNKSDDEYQLYLHEMMNGSGDGGLGMTKWLTDKDNLAYWDKAVRRNVGDEGYARIVALNGAFGIGDDSFRLGYGGSHRFDQKTNQVTLNKVTKFRGVRDLVGIDSSQSTNEKFDVLVEYGDKVRQRMFSLYDAWYAGKLSRDQVIQFNEAYVRAGACGMTNTDVVASDVAYRYAQTLSLMSTTLKELGF